MKNKVVNFKNVYLRRNKLEQIQSYLSNVILICLQSNIVSEWKKQEWDENQNTGSVQGTLQGPVAVSRGLEDHLVYIFL